MHLTSRDIDESHSSLTLVRRRARSALTLGQDAIISMRVDPAPTVEAELVFAGYGLSIPEAHHDDFAGLDVRGKLVVTSPAPRRRSPGPWPRTCSRPPSERRPEAPGRHRHRQHPQPEEHGHPLGPRWPSPGSCRR